MSGLARVSNAASRCSLSPAAKDDPKDCYRSRLAAGAVCCSTSRTDLCAGRLAIAIPAAIPGEAVLTPAQHSDGLKALAIKIRDIAYLLFAVLWDIFLLMSERSPKRQ